MPAEPQHDSLSGSSTRASPSTRSSKARGSERMRWPWHRWQGSSYATGAAMSAPARGFQASLAFAATFSLSSFTRAEKRCARWRHCASCSGNRR
jgi:hypothetical protein